MAFLVTAFIVSGGGLALANFSGTDAAVSSNFTVNNWWPKGGETLKGTQPFQAVLSGWNVERYDMFWSVDDGALNKMSNSYTGSPHKLADVNVDSWNWQADNSYKITYIAKQRSGLELARKSIEITVPNNDTVAAAAAASATTQTATGQTLGATKTSSTTTSTSGTTSPTTSTPSYKVSTNSMVNFYVDPNSSAKKAADSLRGSRPADANLLDKIASSSTARWFGGWNTNVQADVNNFVTGAHDAVPVLVAYNIPFRDCGSYSAGGAGSSEAYLAWIQGVANGIGSRDAWVILEPDAIPGMDGCLNAADQATRLSLLSQAVTILSANVRTKIYIDAGNARWKPASLMAERLAAANVANADGFSLNVSNFYSNAESTTYGQAISAKVNGKQFVIDTSRNGIGPDVANVWCNPAGRALGSRPTDATGNGQVAAFLWIKTPGESDGACNGAPSAGTWWTDYALGLASRAAF